MTVATTTVMTSSVEAISKVGNVKDVPCVVICK